MPADPIPADLAAVPDRERPVAAATRWPAAWAWRPPRSWPGRFIRAGGRSGATRALVRDGDTGPFVQIRVLTTGRPRSRPDRVLADKGYPSKANRAWLRQHDIAATIPDRDDQIAHRRKKPGRPIDFGPEQRNATRDAASSNAASISSSNGEALRCAQTSRPQLPRRPLPRRHPLLAQHRVQQDALVRSAKCALNRAGDLCCLGRHSSAPPRQVQR